MKTVFSNTQLAHAPAQEISDGELKPAVEIPSRAEIVLKTVRERNVGEIVAPEEFPVRPLHRVHAPEYVSFLESFWEKWTAAGRSREAFPFVWPIRSLRQDVQVEHIDGLLGRYSMDAGTPLGENTYKAARASADTALTAARLLLDGEKSAFALCRPPGHHAGYDFFGGYCFFNNAAVAAQYLRDYGLHRIAILDVDYHHGNGTQALFYDRPDILFLSIHADPKHEYPYFLGFADETGEHAGTGFTRNWPLPLGTDWDSYTPALEEACRWLLVYKPEALIVSLGMDCYENDPISGFKFKSEDYIRLGQRLAKVGVPTIFLMEGGYAVDALGTNCVNVLEGFEG
ncbi:MULTISPECIES: histone deacetylase family protein [Stappiaceae]|uniref:Acetylpolyamine aminohydrolase n=1 Tax=Roseibium aggregatum TaxID=187304 RepID=A0A0M6Y4L4_9HYPH|nr:MULTISPECIES: histone deacetylase family protein [Stappiaceae]MBO9461093.1 histone deacetylase family protein [Labrenzia sp. R5_0]MCR9281797.1 histone deacetylase family protein [Paracoccaceae bacterium]MEC9401582.1 histone deacetylase family protein [Pseudomonadota bacterium]NKI59065.1 histone deacetylase family protein [Labrenzia sp. PO1]ERP96609.1 acetylpolyamine aminohydrolase [Labrenzia sp. C1B10]